MSRTEAVRPLVPLENFETTARDLSSHFAAFTESNLREGWTRDGMSIPSVLPPIDWNAHNRSFSYHLHAWDGIADLLIRHSARGGDEYFAACVAHARAWLDEFQAPLLGRDAEWQLDALVQPVMPVEWYDMAVGLRVFRLAYMVDVMVRSDAYTADIPLFREGMLFHLKLLRRDHFFREHSNHGLYQALGQIAAARRFPDMPGMEIDFAIGQERLSRLLAAHFSREGPHREHSPGYHYMLMGSLINARRSGFLLDSRDAEMMAAIEDAFQWMVKPDFGLATTGDTDPRILLRGEVIARLFGNEAARYIISGGSMGQAPPAGVKAYYDAGYAFARLYAPETEPTFEGASYLAQLAAFHSRVHKHADHLAFLWYDRGRDVLVDPGRYAYAGRTEAGSELFEQGFWYADPCRIYVESTRAHNCVEIDSKSYPRRRVRPFGSALRYAGEQGGLAVTDCDATYLRSVRHRRVLVMAPGHFLLVTDWLNDRTAPHDYRQWFQLASEWSAERTPAGIVARASPAAGGGGDHVRQAETLQVVDVLGEHAFGEPVRGQTEPQLQGWTSDGPYSLVPSTSVCLEAKDVKMARFATLFCFGEEIAVDRAATRFNASMRNGEITWRDDRGLHSLRLVMDAPGTVNATLASRAL